MSAVHKYYSSTKIVVELPGSIKEIQPLKLAQNIRKIKLFAKFVLLSRFQEIKSSVSLPPYAYPEKKYFFLLWVQPKVRGIHPPNEKTHSVRDMFRVLSKFAPSSCYTQERLGKKNNVVPQKVDKVDKEFECEKKIPQPKRQKNRDQITKRFLYKMRFLVPGYLIVWVINNVFFYMMRFPVLCYIYRVGFLVPGYFIIIQ